MSVLTPQEKARIEEEERKRHEEEQFRTETRANVAQPASPPDSPATAIPTNAEASAPTHRPYFYAKTTRFLAVTILALLVTLLTAGIILLDR